MRGKLRGYMGTLLSTQIFLQIKKVKSINLKKSNEKINNQEEKIFYLQLFSIVSVELDFIQTCLINIIERMRR